MLGTQVRYSAIGPGNSGDPIPAKVSFKNQPAVILKKLKTSNGIAHCTVAEACSVIRLLRGARGVAQKVKNSNFTEYAEVNQADKIANKPVTNPVCVGVKKAKPIINSLE